MINNNFLRIFAGRKIQADWWAKGFYPCRRPRQILRTRLKNMKNQYQSPEIRLVTCLVEDGYTLSHSHNNPTSDPMLEEFHSTNYNYGDDIF